MVRILGSRSGCSVADFRDSDLGPQGTYRGEVLRKCVVRIAMTVPYKRRGGHFSRKRVHSIDVPIGAWGIYTGLDIPRITSQCTP